MLYHPVTVHPYGPKVAFDRSGNAIAVWERRDSGYGDVCSIRYTKGSGWSGIEVIDNDNGYMSSYPAIAVDASGNVMVVWQQWDGMFRSTIWSNRYVSGAGWETPELIQTNESAYSSGPKIAVDPFGNAIAVWSQFQSIGQPFNIWSNRYTAGAGWGTAEMIELNNEGSGEDSVLAVAPSGNAIALWSHNFKTSKDLWANIYIKPDTTPPPLTVSFPPDDFMTDSPIVTLSGRTEAGALVNINGFQAAVGSDGSFSCGIPLRDGFNTLNVTSMDRWGNSVTVSLRVTYNDPIHSVMDDMMSMRNLTSHLESNLMTLEELIDNLSSRMNSSEEGTLSPEIELLELEVLLNTTNATIRSLEALTSYLGNASNLRGSELDGLTEIVDGIRSNLSGMSSDVDDLESMVNSLRGGLEENASREGEIDDISESQGRQKEELDHLRSFVEVLTIVFTAFLLIFAILFISLFRRAPDRKKPKDRVVEDYFE